MDLLLLAKVLWRKVWILIAVPLIAAFAAYLFTLDIQPVYKSVSQISTGYTINDQVHLADEKFNLRDADMRFSNLLNSMNSSIATNLLSYRLLLHDLNPAEVPFHRPDPQTFSTTQKEKEYVRKIIGHKLDSLQPMASSDPDYQLIRKYFEAYGYGFTEVKDALLISRVPNTDYVQVEFSADRPRLSALAANAFTEEFMRYTNSMKNSRTGESVEFLKQVVDEKKANLDNKLESQRRFKSNNNVLDIQGESGAKITQLTELESQRDLARSNVHRYELTIRQLNEDIANASTPVSNNSNQRILDIRSKINKINEKYVTGGMKDQRLADSLETLREELRIQTDNSTRMGATLGTGVTVADLRSQLSAAQINLQVERENLHLLEAKINSLQYNLSGYANKEASLSAIQKEVDLSSEEYLAAVEKYNEAKNRLADTNTLRQLLVAVPPVAPETSKRLLIVGLAGFTSLTICLFVIVGMELMDGALKTPGKFKTVVGLPLSGSINKIDSRNFNIRTCFNQQNGNEETEMFKSLLRKLRHEIESTNSKVILFTSPKRRDGKTFFIFSLSYVLSLINKRILIIDTNFKNNSLSQILGRNQSDLKLLETKKHKMLAAAQNGSKAEADHEFDHENSYDLINPTKYKNIFIVGNAGGGNESPAEILSGRDFSNLITALSDSFDYILLEGAALNDFSDTKELVKYADKVVAIFSAETAIRQLDRETIYYLKSLGKKFGGAVLNRVASSDLKL
jgi:succinoglycan biosynthesis transport protein ExoP